METVQFLFLKEFINSKEGREFKKWKPIPKDLKGAFMTTSTQIPYVFIDASLFSSSLGKSVDKKIERLVRVVYHELYHSLCDFKDVKNEKYAKVTEHLLIGDLSLPKITIEVE